MELEPEAPVVVTEEGLARLPEGKTPNNPIDLTVANQAQGQVLSDPIDFDILTEGDLARLSEGRVLNDKVQYMQNEFEITIDRVHIAFA